MSPPVLFLSYLLWPTDKFKLSWDSTRHFNYDLLHVAPVGEAQLSGARGPGRELNPRYQNTTVALLMTTHTG